jgi:hypothetical protein
MNGWAKFYARVTKFPWERATHLISHNESNTELATLLVRYEKLKTESQVHLPHGLGLLRRLDKIRISLGAPVVD